MPSMGNEMVWPVVLSFGYTPAVNGYTPVVKTLSAARGAAHRRRYVVSARQEVDLRWMLSKSILWHLKLFLSGKNPTYIVSNDVGRAYLARLAHFRNLRG